MIALVATPEPANPETPAPLVVAQDQHQVQLLPTAAVPGQTATTGLGLQPARGTIGDKARTRVLPARKAAPDRSAIEWQCVLVLSGEEAKLQPKVQCIFC